ncbi:N-6 DNA methylase [Aphanizomenon flos-aquae NRERC-008]|uniref:site-specific DNA-methyltransferase (adenine-specific) n=1 Tax=Aphanizomenon flos-aquae FACHB-1249 TaxID=2692889 RepID=A0ABR8IU89_APHFL|nr:MULTISPECIES: N-6 DNA methylase [Aphanizomenon]MBD2392249.1 N-6 DNA methylase [Aphanizomenon flos-aquae FACHB-1171]MBD2558218.1 N-6 DNA methylase [Aphanizomenon flos-aquae FACHB-1290]MBD2633262.1 N-6 DNA methylase [Aphanizomenon sp. FACHB-1399]MBD2644185.1 N-6 DNA methylase [Aphanizomenon sp. FACHB-1401]MBD2658948.1 N-6 DNA methylase [Aphanizomenon flos-aquae FACHB-1265]
MSQSGLLELAYEKLHWPTPQEILEPSGAGPSVYARIAKEKLGRTISKLSDGYGVQIGVLSANPQGDSTETPIALVCDFPGEVSEETLKKTYRLAWSFSRTPSLITTEPNRLRIWTCYEEPPKEKDIINPIIDISKREIESFNQVSLSGQAAETLRLHWADLVSGQFFQEHSQRFQRSQAADQILLKNLKSVRERLQKKELDDDTIHDLLVRIIFIQFLFDRQDSDGNPALNTTLLDYLYTTEKLLSARYSRLADILRNHRDTYKFFRWLNGKFNGDLFPGKGATEEEHEAEWQIEEQKVKQPHLNILADFVSGQKDIETGQLSLWPYYHFDVIPLEFISSIYEEFVSKESGTGVHYTPEHIVDFVLDGVLPWDSEEWDMKILDPACGSGIFIVKAFQRLIYRWEQAHPKTIQPSDLKYLLENNLFGVDVDAQAVRVASFSLYLTMLDKVEPQYYWENEFRFPRLRERQLIAADFFQEDKEGFRSVEDASKYDLVVGNAPWGKNTVTPAAKSWARDVWTITYGNIGPLFLPKAAALTKSGGQIAMMQPALALIFNQVGTAQEFRSRLFSEFKIDEIVNLSALRFGLFKDAISPACIITMSAMPPDGEPLIYICPKPVMTNEDDYHIVIEPDYINIIYPQEAITDPLIWTALMWGGRRDLNLIRRLSRFNNLTQLENNNIAITSQGIIRGTNKQRYNHLLNRRILETKNFPKNTSICISKNDFSINQDPYAERGRSTKIDAFNLPQLIIKQSWLVENKRFRAELTELDGTNEGIICSSSYVSVHIAEENSLILEAACLSYNSKLAVYYLLLSSGRFASYIPEVNIDDLLRVPIPELSVGDLQNIKTFDDIDERIRQAFEFKDSEWVLINDLFNYTLPDFKGDGASPGRKRTHRIDNNQSQNNTEPELTAYCEYFLRVLKAGFGQDKQVCATIFQEQTKTLLPVRLVAIHLNKPDSEGIHIKPMDSPDLMERLENLNKLYLERGSIEDGGIFYQRVARIYDSVELNGVKIPTIYLIKPDKIRYWTRSMALRDADEVAADIMTWRTTFDEKSQLIEESY